MIAPETTVMLAIALCLVGAVIALALSRFRNLAGWVALGFAGAAAVLVGSAVVTVWTRGAGAPAEFLRLPGLGFALRIYVDGLSAWFLMLAAVISLPALLYSIPYLRHYPKESVARYYPYLMLFLAAMYGLVSTTDMMWFFFVFWQLMTWPGYALIRFESGQAGHVRAANKYLLMMQVACGITMLGAELLAVSSAEVGGHALKYDFDSVSANLPVLLQTRGTLVAMAFALFLAGFGIKLGMWPFGQVWLPDAHPAAPSPVSALLSGVMIKTGVYGIVRYFFWLVPLEAQRDYPAAAWGTALAILGTLTLFTGTWQALRQEQTKRLLAFSSIGQAGYILLGVGVALILLPVRTPQGITLAAAALAGALLHVWNHGLFKSLLFLNAGSLLYATRTQDMNRLGGLLRFMPVTGATALIAALGISGVPLLNGFVSKWCLVVTAVQGSRFAPWLAGCAMIAILTSGLTLALLVKFYGACFLSRTSAYVQHQRQPHRRLEVSRRMQVAQIVLAGLCLVLGLWPWLGFDLVRRTLDSSQQGLGGILAHAMPMPTSAWTGGMSLPADAVLIPIGVALLFVVLGVIASGMARLGRAARRTGAPWLCGYDQEADHHRYPARHYYGEMRRGFKWLSGSSPAAKPDKKT